MIKRIKPGQRQGSVRIPASKSQAHRLLICAALSEGETVIFCDGLSKDIRATIDCLNALGASIRETESGRLEISPIAQTPSDICHLHCGESGSTLRFLLPVVGALGAQAVFHMEGRLPQRPLAPLDGQLTAKGMTLCREGELLHCGGKLLSGDYELPGNVSSQYISGLLMALPLLEGKSTLTVRGNIESSAYITMTEDALRISNIDITKINMAHYEIPGSQRGEMPNPLYVEGDYSNAAFFLCMGALSENGVEVRGLSPNSKQGDREIIEILRRLGACVTEIGDSLHVCRGEMRGCVIDAAPIPDLIPVLSVAAAAAQGETRVVNASRLRLKESDRLESTTRMLRALGADITALEDGLVIKGKPSLRGGEVDSVGDHRIAMAAAAAACICTGDVTVLGSECVAKSYPRFWEDFESMEGGRQ